jgi:phage-related protein (TIGR01555 family)
MKKVKPQNNSLARAAVKALTKEESSNRFPVQAPELYPGVVPRGEKPTVAMDAGPYDCANSVNLLLGSMYNCGDFGGFPGYPYLSMLALRPEYRNMASGLATELTREWITLNSSETAGESTKKKVKEIDQELKRLGVQQTIRLAAEQDAFFGSGQILIDLKGHDHELPLILDPKTIKKNSLKNFRVVEPIWTTPLMYNALDPSAEDFYKPSSWWVMGNKWHASRMLIIITRWVPDILKPAFNFSGISLSQLAEPYVNNWLRARQSVSDLINNFSIIVLKTAMDQVLAGDDDGSDLFNRIKLFTATRSNKGVMALDKDREELEQLSVPIGGLSELQAQAQEQMCSVSRMPAIVLTGISPAGLNASSDGEIRIWYDWIAAQQEAYYRAPIETILKVVQLSMYGEIDPEISFEFNPLYQLTEKELAEVRVNEATRAATYIDKGVLDAQEERERLARDPDSGYQGIDVTKEIEAPDDEEELAAPIGRGTA